MKDLKFVLAFILVMASVAEGLAMDIYVTQNGNAPNTNSFAWLNGGYGSSGPKPGDTIHLVGLFTNILNNYSASGTPGSNITLYFEPNAMFSAPTLVWPNNIWMYFGGMSNIVIDGGVNGIVQCTQNGTASNNTNYLGVHGTNAYTNYVEGIYAVGANNFTVQNLTFSNLYNRLPSSNDTNFYWNAYPNGINLGSGNNIMISNNTFYSVAYPLGYAFSSSLTFSNVSFVNNTLNGWVWGIAMGDNSTNANDALVGLTIRSNVLNQRDDYEGVSDAFVNAGLALHRNGMYLQAENYPADTNDYYSWPANPSYPTKYTSSPGSFYGGLYSNVDISCNLLMAGTPTSRTSSSGSSGIWMGGYSTNQFAGVRIYNNILETTQPDGWGVGINGGNSSQILIANNTFVGGTHAINVGAANVSILNNLQYNCQGSITLCGTPTSSVVTSASLMTNMQLFASDISDYNIIPQGANQVLQLLEGWGTTNVNWITSPYYANNLTQWQEYGPNFDQHSTTNVPALNTSTWVPLASDTVAKGRGTNLSAYFTNDFYGNLRATFGTTNWDIGACAFAVPALPSPTGLHVVGQ